MVQAIAGPHPLSYLLGAVRLLAGLMLYFASGRFLTRVSGLRDTSLVIETLLRPYTLKQRVMTSPTYHTDLLITKPKSLPLPSPAYISVETVSGVH